MNKKILSKPCKKVIVNYIPLHLLSLLKHQNSDFLRYLSILPLKGYLESESESERNSLAYYYLFRGVLYNTFGYDPHQVFCPEKLKLLMHDVLSEFYNFRNDGYVNQRNLESNKIFSIFRSFYPIYNEIFKTKEPFKLSVLTELEHLHNLIILFLLYDLEMTLRSVETRYEHEKSLKTEVGRELC